jgi:hypothetical protein
LSIVIILISIIVATAAAMFAGTLQKDSSKKSENELSI